MLDDKHNNESHYSDESDESKFSAVPHTLEHEAVLSEYQSSLSGLAPLEVEKRLQKFGPNSLPESKSAGLLEIFFNQFRSPLIYVLLVATFISILIQEYSDAAFIFAVLLVNAIIGTIQEFSAQRAASSLKELITNSAKVIRESETYEIDASQLVPGDIVLLESGDRAPADIRLINSHDLEIDESLLTGESLDVLKLADTTFSQDTVIGDRLNMVFSGTIVNRGRGKGVVVSTALATELGRIAKVVLGKRTSKPPLLVRMEKFTHRVAIVIGVAAILMAIVSLMQGMPIQQIFFLSVALAVSAIPEGLPVALTVALSIGMRRMARRNVIVRKLVAVESLGSCTYIATDKTGTLTVNQLTATKILFPDNVELDVSGKSKEPVGEITFAGTDNSNAHNINNTPLDLLCRTAVLANEGIIAHKNHSWTTHGDTVDVALLIMAFKAHIDRNKTMDMYPERSFIPFESENLYSASLNSVDGKTVAFVKGAVEKLLPMCSNMMYGNNSIKINNKHISDQVHQLATRGYRTLAFAYGAVNDSGQTTFSESSLQNLTFIGLVGLIDPLRENAKPAIANCREAGINIAMITGDHPTTAFSIAKELGLAESEEQVVTGPQIKQALNNNTADSLITDATIFARVEPQQKLDIVKILESNGHFVAVSGDGANDAPAMKTAHVGVAMGKSGTDIARETADLIITDDNFASIVAGIEEGRVSYANVRKVIFLLISTGAAEIVLFTLALISGLPLPLLAVQLLWLNLVTNGIQDVALAFEPAEGNELQEPPRKPKESIFNALMIERVLVSAIFIGIAAFAVFNYFLTNGYSVEESRNATLLLMVLFENIHVFNCRSETRSAFKHNPLANPILLVGTILAQLIHIAAMYTPWLNDVLQISPISLALWLDLFMIALIVLFVMELQKWIYKKRHFNTV